MLCYVYPLRFMWAVLTFWLSGGTVGTSVIDSVEQLDGVLLVYGVGFTTMSLILVALNGHAYRSSRGYGT